jgi:hypothetical protein
MNTQDLTSLIQETLGDRKLLLATYHGSQLYGTAQDTSDLDIRVIFAPTCEEILTGKTDFSVDNNPDCSRLGLGDVDISGFSLARYLRLLGKFDVNSVEMLFASQSGSQSLIFMDPALRDIHAKANVLIGTGGSSPIGHARAIAGPYAPDGDSYMVAIKHGVDALQAALKNGATPDMRLYEVDGLITQLRAMEGAAFVAHDQQGQIVTEENLPQEAKDTGRLSHHTIFVTVADRKIGTTNTLGSTLSVLEKPLKRLTEETQARRARMTGSKISPKDLYHAVRILHQYVEIQKTGTLTFPRPNADVLKAIRTETISKTDLLSVIEKAFEDAVTAKSKGLPFQETADLDIQKQMIVDIHKKIVVED